MTVFIIKAIVILIAVILFLTFSSWLGKFQSEDKKQFIERVNKGKEEFIEKAIGKVSSLLTSKIALVMDQYKTGPWYLVVYTQETDHPLWISNNNIRSIHPDVQNRKLIIKQFNGEDMVIENVESYELCPANEMCDYDM